MSPARSEPDLARLTTACRILAAQGHADLNLGHISLRDTDPARFWMKRAGPGLDEVTPDDLLLLDMDGTIIRGDGGLHLEWPIHAEVLRARADVMAVGHTHGFWTAVLSASADATLRPLTHAGAYFPAGVPRFDVTGNLVRTGESGRALAAALGTADGVLMRNHGATFCGSTLEHATVAGLQLERAAHAELTLRATGDPGWETTLAEAEEKRSTIYTDAAVRSMFDWCGRRLR